MTTLQSFIKTRPTLVWSTKNYDGLSDEAIVEAVLNYGNWDDVKTLFSIIGVKKSAEIFRTHAFRPRSNYRADVRHYFQLYFTKHISSFHA